MKKRTRDPFSTGPPRQSELAADPRWYKSGVFYEVHVRAFFDSDDDGVGDFRGLTQKLDYIHDLGVTTLWLLPFYPSPLRDDGYDIADYCGVHSMYGTLADFKAFLREAHRRGLRVITELVLNHTSDQHAWFQRARRAPADSRWRRFYVWSDTADCYPEARIIFQDIETSNWAWDPVAKAYYWHRFFSHQPDLNYAHPEVHDAMFKVVDFWLGLGVDGLRLDAVPYLYEREGTNCENLPETHAFLKKLRAHVDANFQHRLLLGEANQWPEDAAAYFGQGRGDECQMAFHFPLMPRLFMAVRMEDRLPIVDILEQTPAIPETGQWALFLRNHDELTLEMVTDEERDYMYRTYAQLAQARLNLGIRRRLAPLLSNDRKRIELLNALLFSLPGTPILYYGDEIGLGENIYLGDRNGVRTPMQWSSDKNAGFSRANPQRLYLPVIYDPEYHYEANNVQAQLANPHSLLWWMRRLLVLRKRWRALGEGKCEFLQPENRRILSYILRYEQETLLVVANLSRFAQPVELDLSHFRQTIPVELFGRMEFPGITERPYFLTLGPHSFFWFSLEQKPALAQLASPGAGPAAPPTLNLKDRWEEVLAGEGRAMLEALLPRYVQSQTWFAGKGRPFKSLTLIESVPVPLGDGQEACLTFLQVDYAQGESEFYALPLAFLAAEAAAKLAQEYPARVIAAVRAAMPEQCGVLYDAEDNPTLVKAFIGLACRRGRCRGTRSQVHAASTPTLRRAWAQATQPSPEQHTAQHPAVPHQEKVILKLFRRLGQGVHPALELGSLFAEKDYTGCVPLVGTLEWTMPDTAAWALGAFYMAVPESRTAWDFTLDAVSRYFERVVTLDAEGKTVPEDGSKSRWTGEIPDEVSASIGTMLESVRLLGTRTAELHLALAAAPGASFLPEPFTPHYQRSLFQSMRGLIVQTMRTLRRQLKVLPAEVAALAQRVAESEPASIELCRAAFERTLTAQRIRIHGNLSLHQVLWTGKDFVFDGFEGDPRLALSERRIKRSPLGDISTLLRSLHNAAFTGLAQNIERGSIPHENVRRFEPWAAFWKNWVGAAFLHSYFKRLDRSGLLPTQEAQVDAMLRAYLLNATVRELEQELERGPDKLGRILESILRIAT